MGSVRRRIVLVFFLGLTALIGRHEKAAADFDPSEVEGAVVRVFNIIDRNSVGTGTGFVVKSDGWIVTNNHVIDQHRELLVALPGEDEPVPARLIDKSVDLDLAIIKIDRQDLPVVKLSKSDRRKGQDVFALGFPGVADRPGENLVQVEATLTDGVLSREIKGPWQPGGANLTIIQHSASVNKGNSGGPLFDDCGGVIGVNTQKPGISVSGGSAIGQEGVYWSSAIEELFPMLDREGVAYGVLDAACAVSGVGALGGGGGRGGDDTGGGLGIPTPMLLAIGAAAALIAIGGIALMRSNAKPATAAAGSASARAPSSAPKPANAPAKRRVAPPVAAKAPKTAAAPHHLCLSGFTRDGRPVKLEADRARLAHPYGVVIGRTTELAELAFEDSEISRRHARVFWVAGKFFVEDLNSTNGTRVGGQAAAPFKALELKLGSVLGLAGIEVTVNKA